MISISKYRINQPIVSGRIGRRQCLTGSSMIAVDVNRLVVGDELGEMDAPDGRFEHST